MPYRWKEAGMARKCYHTRKHAIAKGQIVLEVKVRMNWQGYCELCGREMVRLAIEELSEQRQNPVIA
jgi:hypothetical protein